MAFTLYGPGVRDEIILNSLFGNRNAPQPDTIMPNAPIQPRKSPEQDFRGQQAQKAYLATNTVTREREPALIAHQIMTTSVVTLRVDTSIFDAWKLFRERRFRHVPILSLDYKLVGILSDRALLRYAATTGNKPPYTEDSEQAKTTIESITQFNVLTATPDTPIREIARMMFEKRVGAMPIVDAVDKIVGIITRADILRTLVNHAPLELWI